MAPAARENGLRASPQQPARGGASNLQPIRLPGNPKESRGDALGAVRTERSGARLGGILANQEPRRLAALSRTAQRRGAATATAAGQRHRLPERNA